MNEQKQRIVNNGIGDCFAACMASLLELPIEVMPNDHSPAWFIAWSVFLNQFGLEISYQGEKGAIWHDYPWIASVKSINYKNGSHAIIVDDRSQVLFDPSTKKTYRKGRQLLGANIVTGGYTIAVSDFTKLHLLKEYRDKIIPVNVELGGNV